MKLKYKVVISLVVLGLIITAASYATGLIYGLVAGLLVAGLGGSVLIFGDKNDKNILSLIVDGLFFGAL